MEVLEIKILHSESGYIYYRISYKAAAVIAFLNTTKELPIDFTIETHASGTKAVDLKLEGSIDYCPVDLIYKLGRTDNCFGRKNRLVFAQGRRYRPAGNAGRRQNDHH